VDIERIMMTGGEARSDIWNQIKADMIGRTINIPEVLNAAALGACILASIGPGIYSDFRDGIKHMDRVARRYKIQPEVHDKY